LPIFNTSKKLFLLLLCQFLFMSPLSAQSITAKAEQHHASWQEAVEGVVMARHADNTTVYGSAGLTGRGGVKPDKTTLFEIGSITKVFTSILLAEAVREDQAEFNDPVSKHLANLTFEKSSPFHLITLAELATHTSGLPRLPLDLSDGVQQENPYVHYDEQRLTNSLMAFRKDQLNKPGEYEYSNYGAGILGYVLSQIYDQPYRDLLKEKILDPLRMTSTDVPARYAALSEEVRAKMATPHAAGRAVNHWELASLAGAGGMISSAEDLIRFGVAHWDEKTPVGLASSMVEAAKVRMDRQGLGWRIDADELTHGGGTGGFRTRLTVNPKDKTVNVFLANSASASQAVTIDGDFLTIHGYWSGVFDAGTLQLRLIGYLSETGRMVLYSIDQAIYPILSAKSSFVNDRFEFSFPSIEAIYNGKFENGELVGTFVQGGPEGRPLNLSYSKDIPYMLRENLKESMQGDLQSLEGYWSGYLGGKAGVFVYLKNASLGDLSLLEMFSPDQHDQAIPVSSASLKNGTFKFASQQLDGEFSGELSEDLKSVKGVWRQQGRSTPVTLSFTDAKPERE